MNINSKKVHGLASADPLEDEIWEASFDGKNLSGNIDIFLESYVGPVSVWGNRHAGLLMDAGHPESSVNTPFLVAESKSAMENSVKQDRVSWNHLPFITVDGENTKDFDDAVCVMPRSDGGWKVRVAIADVADLVKIDSSLDKEARARGATVYLPGDVRPMFPSVLSDGACSLIEAEERNVLGVSMNFDNVGELVGTPEFVIATVKVLSRLSYAQVEAWHKGSSDLSFKSGVEPSLEAWRDWSDTQIQAEDVLFPWQKSEHYINVSESGVVSCETSEPTPKASKMVEIAMVAANRAAAQYIFNIYGLGAFRNHKEPDWALGYECLEKEGWSAGLPPQENAKTWWLNAFKKAEGRPEAWMLAQAWSKMQTAAQYQTENKGHHALAANAYTHFTSPIRRYADLEVHRAIKASLLGEEYDKNRWVGVVDECNVSMKRAKQIERQVRQFWMAQWWKQQDDSFSTTAVVKSVKRDGSAFVITDSFGSDGVLIPGDVMHEVGTKVEIKMCDFGGSTIYFDLCSG